MGVDMCAEETCSFNVLENIKVSGKKIVKSVKLSKISALWVLYISMMDILYTQIRQGKAYRKLGPSASLSKTYYCYCNAIIK